MFLTPDLTDQFLVIRSGGSSQCEMSRKASSSPNFLNWRGEAAILACGGAETFEAVKDATATTCTGKIVQLGNRIFGIRVGRMGFRLSTGS